MTADTCGARLRGSRGVHCERPEGHEGPHCPYGREDCTGVHGKSRPKRELCPGAHERDLERKRAWSAKCRATETVCGSKGCDNIAPVGNVQCPECTRTRNAKIRATETVCTSKACENIAPVGYVRCLECNRKEAAKRRATVTVCTSKGCQNIAPVGRVYCPECNRESVRKYSKTPKGREVNRRRERKRREAKADANYIDLTHLDEINGVRTCFMCSGTEGPWEVEHIIPVTNKWAIFAAECEDTPASGLRWACEKCNRSKGEKDHAAYILERFRAGLPVVQAPTVSCVGCPVLALAA